MATFKRGKWLSLAITLDLASKHFRSLIWKKAKALNLTSKLPNVARCRTDIITPVKNLSLDFQQSRGAFGFFQCLPDSLLVCF